MKRCEICCKPWSYDMGMDGSIARWPSCKCESQSREAKLIEALETARRLLRRYRTETPLGHQPHMIAHEVDAFLEVGVPPVGREEVKP